MKITVFLALLAMQLSFSQTKKTEKDTVVMYNNIKQFSTKHKYTKFLHGLIFRASATTKSEKIVEPKPHLNADGKIIRKIQIVTLDPFGYSDSDSTAGPRNWGERTGNKFHLKTKVFAIRNFLLFKENSVYDLFKIKETERIIRAQNFVNRVTITEKLVAPESDSVDVFIRVLDTWSSIPRFSVSSARVGIGFRDRNIFGYGHQLDYKFNNRFSDGKNANDIAYSIPNFKNSFIRTTAQYAIDLDNYYSKSVAIERPFYSPVTKWAGGITIGQQFKRDSLINTIKEYEIQNFKFSTHDIWLGKAFNVIKGNYEGANTTNLILTGRYLNIKYNESPTAELDPINFYSSEKLFLMGVGLNSREFVQDRYIFRNGIVEDVPIGSIYGITTGYQLKNNHWRPYIGSQFSFGTFHKWGFLSSNFELGTYFKDGKTEQTTFSFQANYFTNLFDLGNWKFRQFIKPQILLGINRQNSQGDQLNINGENGIQGFNSNLFGNNKMILTFQTQSYAPKEIAG
ncbi:hypothetical protein, partial [Flavobacterium sp.]|uniref:hypothetical protein n=1 Tax=Flavobacterium sp. TaxID=239 RepID=UPI00260E7ABE